MRKLAKRLSAGMSSLFPLAWLKRRMPKSWNQLILPFYHLVSDDHPTHIRHLYAIRKVAQFEEDLDYLLQHFMPIDLPQLIAISKGAPIPKGKAYMHLSFDDGLRECAELIAPILLRKGIPASFFINSAFLDNRALMFRYKASLCKSAILQLSASEQKNYLLPKIKIMDIPSPTEKLPDFPLQLQHHQNQVLDRLGVLLNLNFSKFLKEQRPYMNSMEVRSLIDQGFSIGSHSHDHPHYYQLTKEAQLQQTLQAQQFLENKFDLSHRIFAFPFTDFGVQQSTIDQLITELDFDLIFGGAGVKNEQNPKHLQRLPMETQQLSSVKQIVGQEFFYYLMKAAFGKNSIHRKA